MTQTHARLGGVIPVAPTAFTDDGDLDLASQRRMTDFLVDAGSDAICVLANWAEQFEPTATRPADFFVDGTQKKQVPTMHKQDTFKLAKAEGAALLELPYEGDSASMYILLPDKPDGLAAVEKKLGIAPGETSKDFEFSLERVACFGSCALAPVVVIDGKVYGRMTPQKVGELLETLK